MELLIKRSTAEVDGKILCINSNTSVQNVLEIYT